MQWIYRRADLVPPVGMLPRENRLYTAFVAAEEGTVRLTVLPTLLLVVETATQGATRQLNRWRRKWVSFLAPVVQRDDGALL